MNAPIALILQAAITAAPQPATPEQASNAALSGVVVTSQNAAKKPPKVYTPTYKAAPRLAPGVGAFVAAPQVDQIFSEKFGNTLIRSASAMPLAMNSIVGQRLRAKKAAALINAGRCTDALEAVFNEGDGYLTYRVSQVCGLAMPLERPRGSP